MAKRKIIEIDRGLCDGCGLCTTACAEGALEIDAEGKAAVVRELYCDGMGACLSVCPKGALEVVERESEDYDANAAYAHVLRTRGKEAAASVHGAVAGAGHGRRKPTQPAGHSRASSAAASPAAQPLACGCPGSLAREIKRQETEESASISGRSELTQWPVQLHLVSPFAPYFKDADLLIAADCTAFALGSFHQDLLKGKKLVIACPKLDETEGYVEKLAEIIKRNGIRSLTVAIMTVPCCAGLFQMAERAVELSGTGLRPRKIVVGIEGRIT